MSLKRPSYFLRMVFLVDMYKGQPRCKANWKLLCANPVMLSSVLYMARPTPPAYNPPPALANPRTGVRVGYTSKSKTVQRVGSAPDFGVNTISNLPFSLATKSVLRYWSPKA